MTCAWTTASKDMRRFLHRGWWGTSQWIPGGGRNPPEATEQKRGRIGRPGGRAGGLPRWNRKLWEVSEGDGGGRERSGRRFQEGGRSATGKERDQVVKEVLGVDDGV